MDSTTKRTLILPVFITFLFVMVSIVLIFSSSIDFVFAQLKQDKDAVVNAETSRKKNYISSSSMSLASSNNNNNNEKYNFYGRQDGIENEDSMDNNNNENDKSNYIIFNTKN